MAEFWSDYTDFVLSNMDKKISSKYKLSLRALLANPSKYAGTANIQTIVKNVSQEVDAYINSAIAAMPDEKKALDDQLLKTDAVTKQLAQSVSMQAKAHRVPLVKPVTVERDETQDEAVFVDAVDDSVIALIDKLAGSSMMISDFSYAYGKATVGSWLFSGQKNYVLSVYMPDNDVMMLEASRAEIQDLLGAAGVIMQGI